MTLAQTDIPLTRDRVLEVIDLWNSHDVGLIGSLYADEYEGTDIAQAMPHYGVQGARESFHAYWDAFPDLRFHEERILVEGQSAMILWKAQGTHEHTIMKIPPTKKIVTVTGVSVLTFSGDKIVRARHVWDVAGLLRSLGLLPDLS